MISIWLCHVLNCIISELRFLLKFCIYKLLISHKEHKYKGGMFSAFYTYSIKLNYTFWIKVQKIIYTRLNETNQIKNHCKYENKEVKKQSC